MATNDIYNDGNAPINGQQEGVTLNKILGAVNLLASSGGDGALSLFSQATSYPEDTIGKKLQQSISATDAPYNATGDGVTDDTAAIQAAIDAAESLGKVVHLPTGTYKISAPLVLDYQGVGLIGDSPQLTVLDCDGDINAIELDQFNAPIIARIGIAGIGDATSTKAGLKVVQNLSAGAVDGALIEQVHVYGFNIGFDLEDFSNSVILGCGFGGSIDGNVTGLKLYGISNSNLIAGTAFTTNTTGLEFGAGVGLDIIGCDFGGPGQTTQILQTSGTGLVIQGCNMEVYGGTYAINSLTADQRTISIRDSHILNFNSLTSTYTIGLHSGCSCVVENSNLALTVSGAAVKLNGTINAKFVYIGSAVVLVANYSSDGLTLIDTYAASVFPTDTQASGITASASNRGFIYRRMYATGSDDAINVLIKLSTGSYATANLLQYYTDFRNGVAFPQPMGVGQTASGSFFNVYGATNPYQSITDVSGAAYANRAVWGVSTGAGSVLAGSLAGDTSFAAKASGNLNFGTSQVIRMILNGTTGNLELLNNLVFEGSSADANETTITATNPTADRTQTLQDASGVIGFAPIVTNSTPTTGGTVSAGSTKEDETLYMTPAGTLATLTVTLPASANARVGQIIRLFSTQILTSLTVNVSGGGTIQGSVLSTLALESGAAYQCVSVASTGTWIRLY